MALSFTDHLDPVSLGVGALAGGLIGAGIGYSIGYSVGRKEAAGDSAKEVSSSLKKMLGKYEVSEDGLLVPKGNGLDAISNSR